MEPSNIAWRGFVTHGGQVIAWPTLLAQHNDFHRMFVTSDEDFAARWRQWSPGLGADVDPGATPEARAAVREWLNRINSYDSDFQRVRS